MCDDQERVKNEKDINYRSRTDWKFYSPRHKKAHPEFEILGSDREEVENIAQKRGIIDSKVELVKGAQEADIIILAVPISVTLELLKQIATFDLKDGLLITDAGSTKSEIVELANQLFLGQK